MKNYDIKPFLYELQTLLKENRVDEAEKSVDDLIASLEKGRRSGRRRPIRILRRGEEGIK